MHRRDRQRRIDPAVVVDDEARGGLAHAHVMHVAHPPALLRQRGQRARHSGGALRARVAPRQLRRLQRLDMRLDLDVAAELRPQRRLQRRGGLMRRAMRHVPVELEIEADAAPAVDILDRHVMHGQAAQRRRQQHALEDGLVAQRARVGGDGDAGVGKGARDGGVHRALDLSRALQRQRPPHRDQHFAQHLRARRAQPHIIDRGDAGHAEGDGAHPLADAFRGRIDQRVDGAPPQPQARHRDEQGDAGGGGEVALGEAHTCRG